MGKEHMSSQFDAELGEIRMRLLEMGGKVELMIASSVKSLVERDSALAERTIALDAEINRMEVEIDQKCLHLLALRQPAARDLRFVTLALKIVTDLERIADHATNIAEMVIFMVDGRDVRHSFEVNTPPSPHHFSIFKISRILALPPVNV